MKRIHPKAQIKTVSIPYPQHKEMIHVKQESPLNKRSTYQFIDNVRSYTAFIDESLTLGSLDPQVIKYKTSSLFFSLQNVHEIIGSILNRYLNL